MENDKRIIADFKEELRPFLKNNPYSDVRKMGKYFYVTNPWNDDSIALTLRYEPKSGLISTLNKLILPPRFTAIYHLDSNTMEYVYTLLEKDHDCFARQFDFILDGEKYGCKFDKASNSLLTLARLFRRTRKYPKTEYRNLIEFREYEEYKKKKDYAFEDFYAGLEPRSFYVNGFEGLDEVKVLEVSKYLNFFMQYYDRDTPIIIIHSSEAESREEPKQLKIVETTFPSSISTKRQDPILLDLALTASLVTTRLQFIYYYQILEYSAFYYIDDETKRQLLNIINSPDIHSNSDAYIPKILEILNISLQQHEEVRLQKTVKMACTPKSVWEEILRHKSYFSESHEFDGGFILEPLISTDTTLDSFCVMWHPKTADTLRFIRNALVLSCINPYSIKEPPLP